MKCFTFYKGVKDNQEMRDFLDKTGDMPECEMFQRKSKGDEQLIKNAGYIAEETCDDEIFNQIPKTLKEALGE